MHSNSDFSRISTSHVKSLVSDGVLLGTFLHDHVFILISSVHSVRRSKFLRVSDGLGVTTTRSHLTCAFNAVVK